MSTLNEKFETKASIDTTYEAKLFAKKCEKIADDYAICFAEWLSMFTKEFQDGDLRYWNKDKWIRKTLKELLEVFKIENGY